MRRLVRAPVVLSALALFWGGAIFFAWFVVPFVALRHRDPVERRRVGQRLVRRAFRLFHAYARATELMEVEVDAGARLPDGPCVLVANHPSLADVTAILASYDDVCCVVGPAYIRNPLFGPVIRACGHIDAGTGEGLSGAQALEAALQRLREGSKLLVFPEGTRSPPAGMRAFRRGAFEIAKRARVPVVPMLVTCTPPALAKGAPFWSYPEVAVRLALHPQPAVLAEGTSRSLARRVEADLRQRFLGTLAVVLAAPAATESARLSENPS